MIQLKHIKLSNFMIVYLEHFPGFTVIVNSRPEDIPYK